MVHVSVILPGVALPGVNVVLALVGTPNVPAPGGADHVPVPLVVAWTFTAFVPQLKYGPPAFAVAAGFTVTDVVAVTALHGPFPSGSLVVQVMDTGLPPPAAGVNVVFVLLGLRMVPPPTEVHCPVPLALAEMATEPLLHTTYELVMAAVAGALTVSGAVSKTDGQGPVPSGSAVVHVSVMVA